jgi:hypothetical protein
MPPILSAIVLVIAVVAVAVIVIELGRYTAQSVRPPRSPTAHTAPEREGRSPDGYGTIPE